jgi:hypothetical protein
MCGFFEMGQRVTVPADSAVELAPTAERTTGEAEPEVLLEVAFRAMCQPYKPSPQRIPVLVVEMGREGRTYRRRECGPW